MFGIVTLYNNSQSDNLTDKQYRVHYGHDPNDERKAGADNIYNKDCKQTLHPKITVFNTCCVKYNFRFTLIIFFLLSLCRGTWIIRIKGCYRFNENMHIYH